MPSRRAHLSGRGAAIGIASLVLDYAENLRRKLQAGNLRSTTQLEGPHNTTEVLSANTVYHVRDRNVILIIRVFLTVIFGISIGGAAMSTMACPGVWLGVIPI
jgi:hypothetical protein